MRLAEAREMIAEADKANVRAHDGVHVPVRAVDPVHAHLVKSGAVGEAVPLPAPAVPGLGHALPSAGGRGSAATAATGEMGDMLSHRIDSAHPL